MKILTTVALLATLGFSGIVSAQEERKITVFDHVVFYDGYNETVFDKDLDDGILRHRNSLYAVKLSEEQLSQIGDEMRMDITVGALCDNYDRIGNINLALVPKGSDEYQTSDIKRLELGRFITPFMNKNRNPNTVPYTYEVNYLTDILKDANLRESYDLWVEFELFGIPYAANKQVVGCSGRNDVFEGTLEFVTTGEPGGLTDNNVLVPIVIKNPEYIGSNLNNYSEKATDELGQTRKTYTFDVPEDVEDGQFILITSNHGANSGGEEYNRRMHYVYFDGGDIVLSYKPGRVSCEPFRQYNTMSNGIYGNKVRSDKEWQSFSNWCPGDVIDNRIINVGPVSKGEHSIKISVPKAVFVDQQGDIPVSIYFQGTKHGKLKDASSSVSEIVQEEPIVKLIKENGMLRVDDGGHQVWCIELFDVNGALVNKVKGNAEISIAGLSQGVYFLNVELTEGVSEVHKLMLP